jgi:glutathione peroxidase
MSKIYSTFFALLISIFTFSQTRTFHDYKGQTITGPNLNFSNFYGKKVMVVNTASFCGWTYQYETLQDLYDQYKQYNFEIIGFPCNDFSNQEPGSDSTIYDFCTGIYSITFQMMSKVSIVSHDTAEVYKWLQRADLNGVADAHVTWNFNKFLIDEAGHWVRHFTNLTEPFDTAITNWIMSPSVLPDTNATGVTEPSAIAMKIRFNHAGHLSLMFENTGNQPTLVTLISASGQMTSAVHDGRLTDGETIHLDTGRLSRGLYFLRITNASRNNTFKLMIGE